MREPVIQMQRDEERDDAVMHANSLLDGNENK